MYDTIEIASQNTAYSKLILVASYVQESTEQKYRRRFFSNEPVNLKKTFKELVNNHKGMKRMEEHMDKGKKVSNAKFFGTLERVQKTYSYYAQSISSFHTILSILLDLEFLEKGDPEEMLAILEKTDGMASSFRCKKFKDKIDSTDRYSLSILNKWRNFIVHNHTAVLIVKERYLDKLKEEHDLMIDSLIPLYLHLIENNKIHMENLNSALNAKKEKR